MAISPPPPQTPASCFKSLYRKRANTPCSCVQLAHSRFRYNTRTYQELSERRCFCFSSLGYGFVERQVRIPPVVILVLIGFGHGVTPMQVPATGFISANKL